MDQSELVDLLQHKDSRKRSEALAELYPDSKVALIATDGKNMGMASNQEKFDHELFVVLLWACQHMAKAAGIDLNWVQVQPGPNQLVVPQGNGRLNLLN